MKYQIAFDEGLGLSPAEQRESLRRMQRHGQITEHHHGDGRWECYWEPFRSAAPFFKPEGKIEREGFVVVRTVRE